ncbi:MAG: nucleoside triphosphate pyrophosphohydrolase [Actinobacteria bacterium]|nr:nucleoside triphosphate pyrophosphohydrolase [Actinomycetota bacterium]
MLENTPNSQAFYEFVTTIATLRSPDGCPWDREQTHSSIAKNMIEEAFEAVEAIEDGDVDHMREELGDVLLQVVLQAQIASDAGEFSIDDVVADVNAKMVRRHPHVFGTQMAFEAAGLDPESIDSAEDVVVLWDRIKLHERKLKEDALRARRLTSGLSVDMPQGLLDGIPRQQPALMQAQEISKKAVRAGFEWDTEADVWSQVFEEIEEFRECEPGSAEATLEFGDVLFTLVNVARKQGIDAETALRLTCEKFRTRWGMMEGSAYETGREISALSLEEQECLWQQAKEKEKDR